MQVIYIDGSHLAQDVLTDAVMAWKLLKTTGIMILDGRDATLGATRQHSATSPDLA